MRETERIAELSDVLPDTDEFGRQIAVPEVDAYRKKQAESKASESSHSTLESTKLDDNNANSENTSPMQTEESTQIQPVAGGDDADQHEDMSDGSHSNETAAIQDKMHGDQESSTGQEDGEAGATSSTPQDSSKSTNISVPKVVTEVPSSISKELAVPQPKPTGATFFLSTLVDAKAFAAPANGSGITSGTKAKLPVAGLYSLRRMLSYSRADTAEKTMEVPRYQYTS